MATFDYIVVGAGSAGCVLANRLSADPDCTVLLLEAGGEAGSDAVRMPSAWMKTSESPRFNWGQSAGPEPFAGERLLPQPRGKLLGGSSSINGMMYTRGQPQDYDGWALPGWSYREVLPYFRRAEMNWRGESLYHGGGGPMHVSRLEPDPVYYPPLLETARQLGYDELDDFTAARLEGFGLPDFTQHRGRRVSTATAYLAPVRQRRNLEVLTRARVNRVLLQDRRATGVEYERGRTTATVRAAREVILCGGAFNSPQLLLLSGIGPGEELQEFGIQTVHDLPGVGRNLQDHPMILGAYRAASPHTYENHLRLDRLSGALLRWKLWGTGPLATQPLTIQGFVRSGAAVDRPDMQFQVVHVSYLARPWFPGLIQGAGHEISCGCLLLRPDSRGRVSLRSNDPNVRPQVVFNLLQEETDLQRTLTMFHFMRRFFATSPARDQVAGEVIPGPAVQSGAEIEAFVRQTVMTGMHSSCSCAMGEGPESVLDAELKVRGISGLRVVDASVMPRMVSGNTNAPVIMIAEKAADLILNRLLVEV